MKVPLNTMMITFIKYLYIHLNFQSQMAQRSQWLGSSRQTQEMSSTVSKVGLQLTDDDVNNLAARHLEDSQLLEVQWDSAISARREEQKRDFKSFVEESFAGREVSTPVTPK